LTQNDINHGFTKAHSLRRSKAVDTYWRAVSLINDNSRVLECMAAAGTIDDGDLQAATWNTAIVFSACSPNH